MHLLALLFASSLTSTGPLARIGNDFSLIALSYLHSCKIYVTASGITQPVPTIGAAMCEIHIAHYHVPVSRYMHFVSTRPLNAASGVTSGGQAQKASGVGESVFGAVSRAVHAARASTAIDGNIHAAPQAIDENPLDLRENVGNPTNNGHDATAQHFAQDAGADMQCARDRNRSVSFVLRHFKTCTSKAW
jgi:hypothetical protein